MDGRRVIMISKREHVGNERKSGRKQQDNEVWKKKTPKDGKGSEISSMMNIKDGGKTKNGRITKLTEEEEDLTDGGRGEKKM